MALKFTLYFISAHVTATFIFLQKGVIFTQNDTRHNSSDSVPTSNLVCIKEVAIRTTFCFAGIIYYTCNLVTDIQCTRYKMPSANIFKELCVKISLLRSIPKKLQQYVMWSTSGYASI